MDFGGTPGTGFSVNGAGTQITATVPAGTGAVPVTVVTPGGSVGAGSYQYTSTTTAYVYQSQFGNTGTTATGQLSGPQGVATDGAGNVFVADTNNNRVVKFAPQTTTVPAARPQAVTATAAPVVGHTSPRP